MKKINKFIFALAAAAAVIATPLLASAHEVYVLSQPEIAKAMSTPPFSLFDVLVKNLSEFAFWGFIVILALFSIFFISTARFLERRLDPFLMKIRKYGPFVARFTIGVSLIACANYQATFGPELPLAHTFGPFSAVVATMLAILGMLTIVGLYVRPAAFIALLIYGFDVAVYGSYMLTYVNYLGEIIVLLILGAHNLSLDSYIAKGRLMQGREALRGEIKQWLAKIKEYLVPRSFAILRVLFGTALIYADIYAKVLHNNLALFTVQQYHLDKIFGLEAHFLILGGALIEFLIALFFILGIEIRFTAMFLLFWLTLSLIFFGEIVWPHLILIGIPIAYIFYGYDKYSLEGYFFRKKKYEPIL